MSSQRWAVLIARTWQAGKHEIAADILATVDPSGVLGTISASKDGTHPIEDGVVLKDLHEILDETGMESILKISEKRCKELQNLGPSFSSDRAPKYTV